MLLKKAIPVRTNWGFHVLGLEVPHAHVHLIPINQIGDMSFANPHLQQTSEDLAATAELIRSFI